MGIVYHPTTTMNTKFMRMEDRLNAAVSAIIQAGQRDNPSRILEYKLAVGTVDPPSQVASRTQEEGDDSDFANTLMVSRAGCKTGQEVLEVEVSDITSFDRHVDITPSSSLTTLARPSKGPQFSTNNAHRHDIVRRCEPRPTKETTAFLIA
ncbi:hypothetical protein SprV_0301144900 [Sparganum proliferum]